MLANSTNDSLVRSNSDPVDHNRAPVRSPYSCSKAEIRIEIIKVTKPNNDG